MFVGREDVLSAIQPVAMIPHFRVKGELDIVTISANSQRYKSQ
jgi:hypothetical protein